MSDTPPRPRYTLRDLPLPAKLVVSAFLLAVGLGYCSAMVQLHMKHSSREGNPLPTPADVVERFSGYKEFDGTFPKSKIEELISGDPHGGFNKANMTPAFFGESDREYKKVAALAKTDPKRKRVDAEREGERLALVAFINAPAGERKAAYEADLFQLPADVKGKPITADFLADGSEPADGKVKVQSLIGERCGRCHDNQQAPHFAKFDELEPLITAPLPQTYDGSGNPLPAPPTPGTAGGKVWVQSSLKMSEEGLTQSTHAHLLSFAMLFALTGFVYAFTSHPGFVRGVLAPVVLVAQVTDVSCWWLARLPLPYGPQFAMVIMGTGAVVGLGLVLQIVLSLFNMYGVKGKVVLLLLFLAAGGGAYVLGDKVIARRLAEEKQRAAETRAASE
jgi:hypothetical protein